MWVINLYTYVVTSKTLIQKQNILKYLLKSVYVHHFQDITVQFIVKVFF